MRTVQQINTTVRNGNTYIENVVGVYLYDDNISTTLKELIWIRMYL